MLLPYHIQTQTVEDKSSVPIAQTLIYIGGTGFKEVYTPTLLISMLSPKLKNGIFDEYLTLIMTKSVNREDTLRYREAVF